MTIQSKQNRQRMAIDVGGTFIDYVMLDEVSGEIVIDKEPSSAEPAKLADQLMAGLERQPVPLSEISRIFHGMTVSINALVQEKGARVGLITTKGFRDVLEIGRGARKEVYNYLYKAPAPIVERYLRRDLTERMDKNGNVLVPLDLHELDSIIDSLVDEKVEAIAVVFLHSYANPENERAAKNRICERHPGLMVTASHEIASEWREFERTSTTALNSYIQPLVKGYLDDVSGRLKQSGYKYPLAIMQSNGGVCSSDTAGEKPIRTLMSGPAGGVMGAKVLAAELDYNNVICTDVGGTTYDVAIIEDGKVLERMETLVSERPIIGPIIDITSIGAGGGSIAWIDHLGGLRVGPQSAGARPGPVCFGFGGTETTVTDCHLVLGRLDPANFLGSRMQLDKDAAYKSIEKNIAKPLGLSVADAAAGALAIAETNMTYAIRTKTVERGLDPRDFVLLAYGGGGGLFAAATGEELDVPTVIVPRIAANFSAWGILTTDYLDDAAITRVQDFTVKNAAGMISVLRELEAQTASEIQGYGFNTEDTEPLYRIDTRFQGQEYTISVATDPAWLDDPAVLIAGVRKRFVEAHRQLYGHGDMQALLQAVSLRCRTVGHVAKPGFGLLEEKDPGQAKSSRPVHFRSADGYLDTAVYDRDDLAPHQQIQGPAIIEEWTTTTVVPPDWSMEPDRMGNLVMSNNMTGEG